MDVHEPPAIAVSGLSHAFPSREGALAVLDDVSLDCSPGSFVSLIGPSGCGKSTVLRVLAGLLRPLEGTATVGGDDVVDRPGRVAFMPQRDLLLPWRNAMDNATLGAEMAGVPRAEARMQAELLFSTFGLEGFEPAWPGQLSGGMRQRLALLRTFLQPRGALLLDEPFGALDAITRRDMQKWLQRVWLDDRRTVLMVTHDVDEALLLSDRVYVMSPRPGRIVDTVEVASGRPRDTSLVTTTEFGGMKARLLAALDSSADGGG